MEADLNFGNARSFLIVTPGIQEIPVVLHHAAERVSISSTERRFQGAATN